MRPTARRVLFLSWRDLHHPEGGGSEKYLDEVARGLVGRDHRVTVRCASYPGAVPDEIVDGVRYIRRGGRHTVYLRAALALLVGRHRSDVVVDVQNGVPFLSPLVTGRPVVNLVHHVHREQWPVVFGPFVARLGWWVEARLAPAIYRHSTYVAVSASTRRELAELGVDPARTSLVHNGTDAVKNPERTRSARPTMIVLGRLVPQKRVEIALEAAARLVEELPDLHVVLVGSGYWEPRLRDEVRRLGLEHHVTFTGHVSEAEKHRLLGEAWVLALPSVKEGWGLVVVEAGVHGTPTVAFRHAGGLDESVRDGITGLLVDGDVASYTAAVGALLRDRALRERLSAGAAAWAPTFHWDETVRRFESVLAAAVGGSTTRLADPQDDEVRSRGTAIGPEPGGGPQPAS
jgi:glycosyltransferase involved in cell wall biosynthesis